MIISCPDGTKNYVLCENISVFVAHVTMTEPKMKIVSLLLMNQKQKQDAQYGDWSWIVIVIVLFSLKKILVPECSVCSRIWSEKEDVSYTDVRKRVLEHCSSLRPSEKELQYGVLAQSITKIALHITFQKLTIFLSLSDWLSLQGKVCLISFPTSGSGQHKIQYLLNANIVC